MDIYSDYNHIKMVEKDVSHSFFYVDSDMYHYMAMSLALINASVTYQSIVNKFFIDIIGNTIEAYIDDMLVKSKVGGNHQRDLERAFAIIRLHNVRLIPTKCAFDVNSRELLGFMVSRMGIEVNPKKLSVIEEMRSPTCHKKVHCLNRCLAALRSFLSKPRDKSLPFFQVLQTNNKFEWTTECEDTFQQLKII